jgi:SAM-dependent methyltransferase
MTGSLRQNVSDVQTSYNLVADEYVRHLDDELQHKPFDRELLNRFAERVRNAGLICDIGTGPGHVARYLHDRGVNICGIDLAPEMVDRARRLNPGIAFQQGDMFALDIADETFGGITAFYALVNIPRADVGRALRELLRILKPGSLLLLAFHLGDDVLHRDEMWGVQVSLDFYFFGSDEMAEYLRAAGFEIDEIIILFSGSRIVLHGPEELGAGWMPIFTDHLFNLSRACGCDPVYFPSRSAVVGK